MEAFVMEAYVQVAVAKHLNPRCATSGVVFKENCSTLAAAQPSVCDQRCGIRGRGADEEACRAAECSAGCATVVNDRRAARGGAAFEAVEECGAAECAADRATVVDDRRAARGRGLEEIRFAAECPANCGAVVGNRRVTGGRGAEKIRLAAGAEPADRATVVDDRRAARGRTASEFRAALKWAGNRAAHVDKGTIARG